MSTKLYLIVPVGIFLFLAGCSKETIDFRNAEVSNSKVYKQGEDKPFTGIVTNVPYTQLPVQAVTQALQLYLDMSNSQSMYKLLQIKAWDYSEKRGQVQLLLRGKNKEEKILCDVSIKEGMLDGETTCYPNTAGERFGLIRMNFKLGELNGKFELNDTKENKVARKVLETAVQNGLLNGDVNIFSRHTGKTIYHIKFQDGKPIGESIWYSGNGNIMEKISYENGKLDTVTVFDPKTQKPLGTARYEKGLIYSDLATGTVVKYQKYDKKTNELIDEIKVTEITEYQDGAAQKTIQFDENTGKKIGEMEYRKGLMYNGVYFFSDGKPHYCKEGECASTLEEVEQLIRIRDNREKESENLSVEQEQGIIDEGLEKVPEIPEIPDGAEINGEIDNPDHLQ